MFIIIYKFKKTVGSFRSRKWLANSLTTSVKNDFVFTKPHHTIVRTTHFTGAVDNTSHHTNRNVLKMRGFTFDFISH